MCAGDFVAKEYARSPLGTQAACGLAASLGNAVWVIHPYVLPLLTQLADGSGRIVWVPNIGGAQEKIPGTLFGRPVLYSEKMPALSNDVTLKADLTLVAQEA